jgi:Domain of unknown function (DUF4838)/Glycosyl hydrolase family 67 N-terminus
MLRRIAVLGLCQILIAQLQYRSAYGEPNIPTFAITAVDTNPVTIYVPPNCGSAMQLAARELQKYVGQITGAKLKIVLDDAAAAGPRIVLINAGSADRQDVSALRDMRFPPPEQDGFLLRTVGKDLVIAGSNERSVLFGAYDLLERVGCRWIGPGQDSVPRANRLEIPRLDAMCTPALRWRALELIVGSNPAVVDWMAKARLNVAWPEAYVPMPDLKPSKPNMDASAVPAMVERGLTVFWGGHVLPQLFPPERYTDHPEYFAQINGKRLDPNVDSHARGQLCTSNPLTMRILGENTVQFLRNHPWIDVLFLWGNDTTQWCECEACRKLEPDPDTKSPFGGLDRSATYCRMIKIVNEVVQKELPGRKVAFNHYYNLEGLPADSSSLPGNSVFSAVDAYGQCDRHSFSDKNCPRGKRVEPIARLWTPHYKDSVSWSYYFAWNFMKGLPISMAHKIPEDFRFIRSLGVNGVVDNVTLHPASTHWRMNELNFHVYAKAAWDPDLNVEETLRDFFHSSYGPAAEPMTEFWQLVEDATTKFGVDPAFLPEDNEMAQLEGLGRQKLIHEWIMNIRYLIPNRAVFEKAQRLLGTAAMQVATADGTPLRADYADYVRRISLMQLVIGSWEGLGDRYQTFGFLNGGAVNWGCIYSVRKSPDDAIDCNLTGGNNLGDCFWRNPLGREQLAKAGDAVEVDAQIHVGADVIGEASYRAGPGLYQAHDQTSPLGGKKTHSLVFFIGNANDDRTGPRRVILQVSDGGYETSQYSSADMVWKYGQSVRLRIKYLGETAGKHGYRYSYKTAADWVEVATLSLAAKMPFVAPMHLWRGAQSGAKTNYPVVKWATVKDFTTH